MDACAGRRPPCCVRRDQLFNRIQASVPGVANQLERQLAEKPDAVARERQRPMIERGLEAPSFAPAIRMYDKILTRMSKQLDTTPWLAGNEYSLADVGIIPYVLRLEHLQLTWMWERTRPAIGRWLERGKKRGNYSGIANYLDSSYVDLMNRAGREARGKIEAILAA